MGFGLVCFQLMMLQCFLIKYLVDKDIIIVQILTHQQKPTKQLLYTH